MQRWRSLILVAHALVCPLTLMAQTTGRIEGMATDSTGAAISAVTVQVGGPALQGIRTAVTNSAGLYRISSMPAGNYRVRANRPGFRTVEKETTVRLGGTGVVDFRLDAAAQEELLVKGAAPPIDTASTTSGTNYTSNIVAQLPVNRNYADIVRANPGVSIDPGGYTDGRFVTLSIYGATAQENQWIVDGVNTTQVRNGSQGKAINNEFVQEVSVMTGGYSAAYGRATGGVISAVTKSGGNQFHGDGFVYYDSNTTMAQQQFKPGDSIVTSMLIVNAQNYDYGADLGGFLLKDRLWFFAAYNRTTGDSQLARQVATPNVPTSYLFPLDVASNYWMGKLTWNAAAGTTIIGSAFADPSTKSGLNMSGGNPLNTDPSTWYSATKLGGTDFGLSINQLFGSWAFVSAQGAYHRDQSSLTAPPGIRYTDQTCDGGTPDHKCAFPNPSNSVEGGYGPVMDGLNHYSSRKQVALSSSLNWNDHQLKLGGDYLDGVTQRTRFYTGGQQVFIRNEYGQLYYQHTFFSSDRNGTAPLPGYRAEVQVLDYGAYAEDSWRIRPNVTINLGLRWDGETTRNGAGESVLRFDDEWQPRVGVTWDPWNDGTTKVYAFAGRISNGLPTTTALTTFGSTPYTVTTYNFDPVELTQDPNVIRHPQTSGGGAPFGYPVDNVIGADYLDEVTVGIERLVLPTLTLGLKGTYRSLHRALELRCDFDYTAPALEGNNCGLINPGSTGTFASGDAPTCTGLDPPFGTCSSEGVPMPPARRYYRGLEVVARDSVANNLWLQASYVYSQLKGNLAVPDGFFDPAFNYPALLHNADGELPLDRTNRFRLDGYWVSPWRVVLGLQAYAETGAPLSRFGYFNANYDSYLFLTPQGSEGRLPALWGANLTLSYPIYLGPVVVTLQGYFYNIFNKQTAISKDEVWSYQSPPGYPATIFDPNQPQTNSDYGHVTSRSTPRLFRAAIKVSF